MGQVIYELHIGTFTQDGTWRAAAQELSKLAELGVTLIELMPVAEFDATTGGDMTASTCSRRLETTGTQMIFARSSMPPIHTASV